MFGRRLQQIPQIAPRVSKHRHGAIRLLRWLTDEGHTLCLVGVVVALEVVCVQEQENPATGLVADATRLLMIGRSGKQEPSVARVKY
jgi:hypothetical protein